VVAALAAEKGLAGALDVLEGPVGFGVATAGVTDLSVSSLGDPFCVTATTVKYHACCGHTFAAIDAALELRADGVQLVDITGIEIETYETATRVAGRVDPADPDEAKFSLAYTVAAALVLVLVLVLGSVRLRTGRSGAGQAGPRPPGRPRPDHRSARHIARAAAAHPQGRPRRPPERRGVEGEVRRAGAPGPRPTTGRVDRDRAVETARADADERSGLGMM
jgi:2-methylcitrate dehydratase PrpD